MYKALQVTIIRNRNMAIVMNSDTTLKRFSKVFFVFEMKRDTILQLYYSIKVYSTLKDANVGQGMGELFLNRTILHSCFQYQQDMPSAFFKEYVPASCSPFLKERI